jgi:lysophospholipase L1-like esterase
MQHNAGTKPIWVVGATLCSLSIFSAIHYAAPKNTVAQKLNIWNDVFVSNENTITENTTNTNTPVAKTTTKQHIPHALFQDYTNNNQWQQAKLFMRNAFKNDTVCNILWFGDSFIEGDYITGIIRQKLQQQYGGIGTGFVPIHETAAMLRTSCTHNYKGNWQHNTAAKNDAYKPFLNNQYSLAAPNASFSITPKIFIEDSNMQLTIWHKNEDANTIMLNDSVQHRLPASTNIISTNVPLGNTAAPIHITNANGGAIYGMEYTNRKGIQLHNISLRGSNGIQLTNMDSSVFIDVQQQLNPNIIIIQYGANVAENNNTRIDWYERAFDKAIQKIQRHFTNAVIVIVGMADKASKRNNQFETDDAVPIIVQMQQKTAVKNNAVFVNLYQAMGGYNSIKHWVEGDTCFAYKDYTHLNEKGNKKMAQLLYNTLF